MKKMLLLFIFLCSCLILQAQILVRNAGIGGMCSAKAINSCFNEVLDYKPDTVILSLGLYDAINPASLKTPEQFEKNYLLLITKLKKGGVKNIAVITVNPVIEACVRKTFPNHPVKTDLNKRIILFNEVIKKIASAEKLIVIDLHNLVMTNGGATETASSLIGNRQNGSSANGMNLSNAGYKLLAENIVQNIKSPSKIVCYGDNITFGSYATGSGTVTGNCYPAHLWRLLNPSDMKAKRKPEEMLASSFTDDGNLLRNPHFAAVDDNNNAVGWAFWKKNRNSASPMRNKKNTYMHLQGAANSEAFLRSEYIIRKNNRYIFKCLVRGEGSVTVGYARCANGLEVTGQIVMENRKLTAEWSEISVDFTPQLPCKNIYIYFKTRGEVDIANCSLFPVKTEKPSIAVKLNSPIMSIAFAKPESGGGIVSLKNAYGVEFINLTPIANLWRITMRKIKFDSSKLKTHANLTVDPEQDDGLKGNDSSGNDILLLPAAVTKKGAVGSIRKISSDHLVMEWKNISVGKEKNILDVQIDIKILPDGSCNFQGSLNNRSKEYTVYYFECPRIDGIGGVRNDFASDKLATPFFNGRLIADPVREGLLRGTRKLLNPNRSGHSLHMDVFSNKKDSLYLAVLDKDQNLKRWLIESSKEHGILWSVVNVPNNMRKIPQYWRMPYQVKIMPFKGDWFDGCRIYRNWAVKQFWCANGKLADRKDIPVWFKELSDWFCADVSNTHLQNSRYVNDLGKYGLGAWVTYWGKDHDKNDRMMSHERFSITPADQDMLDFYRKNNVKVSGYVQCLSWSDASEAFKKSSAASQNLVRNYYGQIVCWPKTTVKNAIGNLNIAYPGKLWTDTLSDTLIKMAKAGFDCAYLDSGNHGGTYMNFTPLCNPKESGGGTGYLKGNMNLLQTIRKRAREYKPDLCITAESFWEGNIGSLDAFLAVNTTAQYLENTRVTAIPMAHAVYHDYTIFKCAWSGKGDVENDNALGFIAKYAQLFCWGGKSGFSLMNQFYKFPNREIVMESTKHRFQAYAKGKKFLVYGEMQRQPETTKELPLLPVKWDRYFGPSYWNIQLPQIFSSMWKAQDESCGLVAYNIGEKGLTTEFVLPHADYGKLKTFKVLYPEQLEYSTKIEKNKTFITVNCPARVPVIIEMKEK